MSVDVEKVKAYVKAYLTDGDWASFRLNPAEARLALSYLGLGYLS